MVLSGPLDQVTEAFCRLVAHCHSLLMQIMASRSRKRKISISDHVCAHYVSEDQLVRWVSSHNFYLRQMSWCVREVSDYWRASMREYRGLWPLVIPTRIRFCVSWLAGIDCTDWPVRDVCVWLNHRLSRGHKFESVMYMSWICNNDPCPLVETARPPWSRRNVPTVVGRVHLPPPQFILRVETTVKDTDIPCYPESAHAEPVMSATVPCTDVGTGKENAGTTEL